MSLDTIELQRDMRIADVWLYSVGGQTIFPVYGVDGSIVTRNIAYLVRRVYRAQENKFVYRVVSFWVPPEHPTMAMEVCTRRALEKYQRGEYREVDENGGLLGLPDPEKV